MAPSTKNSVILGEALASEEVNLVFPTEDFSRQAHVSSIQKVPFLHLFLFLLHCIDLISVADSESRRSEILF